MKFLKLLCATVCLAAVTVQAEDETGFVSLFDGKTLNGWKLMAPYGTGYGVTNGAIYCGRRGGGNLLSEKEFEDFVLRFEFKLEADSNNGIGIRAPFEGDAAYAGMEIQVIDDNQKKYGTLQPWQVHGSVYGVFPAKNGFQKPIGEWNQEEIVAQGRHIKVTLNGHVVLEANLNDVHDPAVLAQHSGILRSRGHVGFLGHDDYAEFRNIRVKELPVAHPDNTAPEGFAALFNGKDLTGWKGFVESPLKRAKMSAEELATAQKAGDENMKAHWSAKDGVLLFDGAKTGKNLCSEKDHANFELLVDWKISPKGDSGIYLRSTPQVQIWDPSDKSGRRDHSVGSGGLHNNAKNPNVPTKKADKPVGEWNHFQILMVGDKATVYLNDELVVQNVTFENYWEKDKPMYPTGLIELQNHHSPLFFKNVYVRDLPTK
ncbi:MAG: hypothetical protein JWM68_2264 [Verrucomicrobiales bacterium]|nr:hypothetical protein [Verrucomicrobiales bacterium]